MTRPQLAKKLALTQSAIIHWENNDTQPSYRHLVMLAKVFKVTMVEFFGPVPKAEPKAS